ncbi:hypothetical protein jhhlp_000332 [Lomentospora prolificans]|uniref:Enoyl reductase (ER) domain-containing protein n=1 Tax=Lomentospora prolificans TaxID=41688 RepID=A0A2N3NKS5_9PEZI|nr:hypothetical protein jhhlp_000332 [Lomentospora prolificans]
MKQWVSNQDGLDNLQLLDVAEPTELREGEVLVKINRVSLNYRDTEVVMGLYGHHKSLEEGKKSIVPCSDICGTVVKVGPGNVEWREGDRVMATFNQGHLSGQVQEEHMGTGLGLPLQGCLTQYRVFPDHGLVKVPNYLTDEEAAALPIAALTAWMSINTFQPFGQPQTGKDKVVLLQGTGGVAISGLQIAHALGMTTIITSSSDAKLERAKTLGADYTINYKTYPDWDKKVMEITKGKGANVIFECGGAETLRKSFACVAFGGLISCIGYLSGKEDKSAGSMGINVLALSRNVTLKGILNGPKDRFEEMLHFYNSKEIHPVIDREFEFEEAKEALKHLFSGSHFGKVIVKVAYFPNLHRHLNPHKSNNMMKAIALFAVLLPAVLAQETETFTNPVVYEDFADNDVFLGPDGAYYFSASNMHYSPGAPILRSYDLANWEFVGHSVPTLDFGERYNLTNGIAYRGGTWASTMRYRESTKLWYWIGCVDFWYTYTYTASDPAGPWTRAAMSEGGRCYYDCGLFIDDDDTMYVVYGATDVRMAQLSPDGLSQVRTETIFSASDAGVDGIEGNRLYKKDGFYYILNDHPGSTTYIWRSESPWGPWEYKILVDNIPSPVQWGGTPHQGSLIETPEGNWYYMSFTWAYPAGRMPVLAPVTWGCDGFPTLVADENGGWGQTYPMPYPAQPLMNWTGTDTFQGSSLAPEWEWNHNPDETKYKVDNGLTLSTATVTDDFYKARNTLTHRIHGEFPVGTVHVDFSDMADGDIFGFAAFRDRSAAIEVFREGDTYTLRARHNMTQEDSAWETVDQGTVVASEVLNTTEIWLQVSLDARPSGSKEATFHYSLDGASFTALGGAYQLWTNWTYFMGYRYGIFNYATKALGGTIKVLSFTHA